MTAKRFMVDDAGELIDLNNHKFIDYGEECCNLLNELNDENIMLKESIERFIHKNDILRTQLGVDLEMTDKEVTIDLNELNVNIQKEIIFKSDLNKWIERKMDYYERMMEKTDGSNYLNAKGHLDMLIVLKEWIKQR